MGSWTNAKMEWVVDYAVAKILPLVTLWKMRNLSTTPTLRMKDPRFTDPLRVVKWSRFEFHKEQDGDEEADKKLIYHTMEPEEMFRRAFSHLCDKFEEWEESKKKKAPAKEKKKTKPTKRVEDDDLLSIEVAMGKMNLKSKGKDDREASVTESTGDGSNSNCELVRRQVTSETEKPEEGKEERKKLDTFDDLIREIKGDKNLEPLKVSSRSSKVSNKTVRRDYEPFSISSSESEDGSSPPPSHLPMSAIPKKIAEVEKKRMSFSRIKDLEDSLTVELGRRIELNQSVTRERDVVSEAEDDENDPGDDDDDDDDDEFGLTFDLSYG